MSDISSFEPRIPYNHGRYFHFLKIRLPHSVPGFRSGISSGGQGKVPPAPAYVSEKGPVQCVRKQISGATWTNALEKNPVSKFQVSSMRQAMIVPGGKYPHLTIDLERTYRDRRTGAMVVEFRHAHYSFGEYGLRIPFYDAGTGLMVAESEFPDQIIKVLSDIRKWISGLGLRLEFADARGRTLEGIRKEERFFGADSPGAEKKVSTKTLTVPTTRSEGSTPVSTPKPLRRFELPEGFSGAMEDLSLTHSSHSETSLTPLAKPRMPDLDRVKSASDLTPPKSASPRRKKKKAPIKSGGSTESLETEEDWAAMLAEVEKKSPSASPSVRKAEKVLPTVKENGRTELMREWEEALDIPDFDLLTENVTLEKADDAGLWEIVKYYNIFGKGKSEAGLRQNTLMMGKVKNLADRMGKARSLLFSVLEGTVRKKRAHELLSSNLEALGKDSDELIPTGLHRLGPGEFFPAHIFPEKETDRKLFRTAVALSLRSTGVTYRKLRVQEYFGMTLNYANHLSAVCKRICPPFFPVFDSFYNYINLANLLRRQDRYALMPESLRSTADVLALLARQDFVYGRVQEHIDYFHGLLDRVRFLVEATYSFGEEEWRVLWQKVSPVAGAVPKVPEIESFSPGRDLIPPEHRFSDFLSALEVALTPGVTVEVTGPSTSSEVAEGGGEEVSVSKKKKKKKKKTS
ncbi:hypothetical protein FUAX_32450 [Fulvitalea axinellae]|uniref:Uncharacterized protein n=1 Tax=Fulvitalea axinellae TaxID=1182444 RepID=A0AAU9CKU4_9BACT|nr:hypothetical protein FUAX_32450 [Fulvitalea axinellae]